MKIKNIAIIDADLIDLKRHRFPNLACMKLFDYYEQILRELPELAAKYFNLKW